MYPWRKAKIVKTFQVAADMKSIIVVPADMTEEFPPHRAGQHFELCLPGTNIIRKYSVVSPIHTKGELEFGVQLIENGELSPKLWALEVGDEIEIRGPIGRSFVWDEAHTGPLVLIGAGSGITPILCIYNSFRALYPEGGCVFIMSAKDASRIMYYEKLKDILITRFTKTEGRMDREFLKTHIGTFAENPNTMCYISGPDNFVDDMVDIVSDLGIHEDNIRSERFI